MKKENIKKLFWISGIIFAAIGIVISKFLIKLLPFQNRISFILYGYFLGFIGLALIYLGIKKKKK